LVRMGAISEVELPQVAHISAWMACPGSQVLLIYLTVPRAYHPRHIKTIDRSTWKPGVIWRTTSCSTKIFISIVANWWPRNSPGMLDAGIGRRTVAAKSLGQQGMISPFEEKRRTRQTGFCQICVCWIPQIVACRRIAACSSLGLLTPIDEWGRTAASSSNHL
jgi:hypothetical protein